MRIAIIDKGRCKAILCGYTCINVCPVVRTGGEAIIKDPENDNRVIINEGLCTGCGICPKKCPFNAIKIINLPEEGKTRKPIHQYGVNGFRLYDLPNPRDDGVIGILGKNGIGKTTLLKILSGKLKPNLGRIGKDEENPEWNEIIEMFRGREIQGYLEKLKEGKLKAVYKPQFVDTIPNYVKGNVFDILKKNDEKGNLDEIIEKLNLNSAIGKNISDLSGGELQKVAIATTLVKDADVYLIDEPSAYLDVEERLKIAKVIREMKSKVFVVEHDLVVLDYLSDYVHILFGKSGAYGIVSGIKGVRVGVNEYLQGFLKAESIRFRDEEIKFELTERKKLRKEGVKLCSYPDLSKAFGDDFSLKIKKGSLKNKEVLGILGPNAIGKTTFVKILADVMETDNKKVLDMGFRVSYKPQYVKPREISVRSLGLKPELIEKFGLKFLMDKKVSELSGGERQKVAISECLSKDADIYLIDEPSAYLDIEERLKFSDYMEKFSEKNDGAFLIVDHDLLLIDTLSNKVMVFSGESGKKGVASEPMDLKEGLNAFLKDLGITFRRDPETGRPRANKENSVKDREQKGRGEYYYLN